jgi:electron transfer flavoprotein alpha subunit
MRNGDLWLVLEQRDGELLDISKELCSQGKRMKGSSSELVAILVGREIKGLAFRLGQYGVEKVYLVEGEEWERFNPEALIDLLSRTIVEKRPSAVLFGSTSFGNALAPRLAIRHQGTLVTDCIDLRKQGEGWVALKPVQGGKLNLRIVPASARLPFFTLQPGVFEIEEIASPQTAEIKQIHYETSLEKICTKIIGFIKADPKSAYLEEAELVVAGGKGLSDGKGFGYLEELADLLGATVAGSRVAVDLGWGRGALPGSPKAKVLSGSSLFAEKDFEETLSGNNASIHFLGMPHSLDGYTPPGHSA